jgi:transcriptional regulator GlxA family with amidase domain
MRRTVLGTGHRRQWQERQLALDYCHCLVHHQAMTRRSPHSLHDVVAIVADGAAVFELGVVCEVFGLDRSADGLPRYDFALAAVEPGPVTTSSGFTIIADHGLDRAASADLVVIPAWHDPTLPPPERMLAAVRDAVARGARVLSVCSGAFVLAAAGVLDGRRAATHWRYASLLAEMYPLVDVDPDVLYVDDGPVLTSAGTAAGIDACLHLVRTTEGARVANAIARRMVVPPHREGGQAQYIECPLPAQRSSSSGLPAVLDWVQGRLTDPPTVEEMAARARMSPRTFARRFRETTGSTPHAWVLQQRVQRAQEMLEEGDLPIEQIARECGFAGGAGLREHFVRLRGVSPLSYRRTFATRAAA